MGCCTSDRGVSYTADGPSQCRPHGAYEHMSYSSESCSCHFVSRLASYLTEKIARIGGDEVVTFATWSTFDFLYEFRDQVLKQCKTGRHALDLYSRYARRAAAILDRHKKLKFEALRIMLLGTLFARRVMVVKSGRTSRYATDKPLDPKVLRRALSLARQLRRLAPNHEMDEPVAFAEALLSRIRGRKPAEVWAILQKPPQTAPARSARRR
jgi:hypothetical protein